jgi:cytochrome P450
MSTTTLPKGPKSREARQLLHSQPQTGWTDLVRKYGNTFTYQGVLVTCEPEVVNKLLMTRSQTQNRSAVYKMMSRLVPGAPGVLFMDGEQWQQHVQAVMPVFTKANIDSYTETIHDTVRESIAGWRDGQKLGDLYSTVTDIGLRVVLRVGYGLDPDNPLVQEFGRELQEYKVHTMTTDARIDDFGFSLDQVKIIPSFFKSISQLKKRVKRLNALVQQIIDERESKNDEGKDWFTLLHKAGFPLPEMTDELNHIYGAFNAIDYTLTCGLYELSKNPEWRDILRAELQSVLKGRTHPSREDFEKLPNTMNFMKEVFRHYPVAIIIMRQLAEPLQVNGGVWPAKKEVMVMLQSLHHHPDYWDDPHTFDPNRWKTPLREPRAYVPFLTGPRQCIGKHLAELHFVITLNAVLSEWNIDVYNHNAKLVPYMNPRFEGKLPATLHRISE